MGIIPTEEQTFQSFRFIQDWAGNPLSLNLQMIHEPVDDSSHVSVYESIIAGYFGIGSRRSKKGLELLSGVPAFIRERILKNAPVIDHAFCQCCFVCVYHSLCLPNESPVHLEPKCRPGTPSRIIWQHTMAPSTELQNPTIVSS